MKNRFNYDVVVKDLFQRDHPSLLDQLTGGMKVREFLNLELAAVEDRRADLLILLEDDSILHIDFQSNNDPEMPYREALYGVMASWKYKRRIQQVVLYMGAPAMRMDDRIDMGTVQAAYRLMDIRELDAESMLLGARPADYALAMLARGGTDRLRRIVEGANRLPGPARQRALTQLAILSGLRGASERLTMEFKNMGISVEIDSNVFLKEIHDSAVAKGRAEGKAEGKAEGMVVLLRDLLDAKFGKLPKWADERLQKATAVEAERWAKKVLSADTLEGVIVQ